MAMTDALAHRGPDGRGLWTSGDETTRFGHRRLAIVGVDERGAQPMTRGSCAITCNGEIYNYPELRRELERLGRVFTSACDTEVILHAYEAWGPACLKRLNGMFAFALHDGRRGRVMIARDPLGIKPLVYARVGRGLVFASEPKALFCHPDVVPRPDFDVIRADLIHDLWGPRQGTWFAGVVNLAPGAMLLVDCRSGATEHVTYWAPPSCSSEELLDEAGGASRLSELFRDSVGLQLLSDVGVSTTCSGGLDSSAVTTTAAMLSQDGLDAFTVEYDDSRWQGVARSAGNVPGDAPADVIDLWHALDLGRTLPNVRPRVVSLSRARLLERSHIDAVIRALDGGVPLDLRSLSVAALYAAIRQDGHKVVLTGEGADELWLGYYHTPHYEFLRFPPRLLTVDHLADDYFPHKVFFGFSAWRTGFLTPALAREISRAHLDRNFAAFASDDPVHRLTYLTYRTHLQALLTLNDKLAMMNSVENRVPWLDPRLAALSFQISGAAQLGSPNDNKAKWINRQALAGLVPDAVIRRAKAQFPGPPVDRYREQMRVLVAEDHDAISRSSFLREMLTEAFLAALTVDPQLTARDLFVVYSMWRFGELYRL